MSKICHFNCGRNYIHKFSILDCLVLRGLPAAAVADAVNCWRAIRDWMHVYRPTTCACCIYVHCITWSVSAMGYCMSQTGVTL